MKKSITWATIGTMALASSQPAKSQFDPVSLGVAGASMVSTLIGMGSHGGNAQLTATLAQMQMLAAIGQRLTAIEGTLAAIMDKLDALPMEIQETLAQDGNRNRIEETVSAISRLKVNIAELPLAQKKGRKAADEQSKRVLNSLDRLQFIRGELFQRSDLVIPEIVSALVTEVIAADTMQLSYSVPQILREYHNRLSASDSPALSGSLFNLRKDLETQLSQHEKQIALLIDKGSDGALSEGTFPWYAHTKIHTEERTENGPIHSGGADRLGYFQGTKSFNVNVVDHSRTLYWVVKKVPIDDENASGLFHLQITPDITKTIPDVIEEIYGGNVGIEPHASSDKDYEKAHHQDDLKTMSNLQERYNKIVNAINSVRRLQAIASAGRSLILKWSFDEANKVIAGIKDNDFAVQNQMNDLEQKKREAVTDEQRQKMDAARINSEQVDREAFYRVAQVMELARKDKWRSDFANYVNLMGQSYNVYRLAAPYFQTSDSTQQQNDKPTSKREADGNTSPSRKGVPARTKGAAKTKEKPAVTHDNSPKFSLAENPKALVHHMEGILDDAERQLPEFRKTIPEQLSQQEVELMEVEEALKVLPETDIDKTASTTSRQLFDATHDALNNSIRGGGKGAAKTILKETLMPTYLGDDGFLGADSLSLLRSRTHNIAQSYFHARFGYMYQVPLEPGACAQASACIKSYDGPVLH